MFPVVTAPVQHTEQDHHGQGGREQEYLLEAATERAVRHPVGRHSCLYSFRGALVTEPGKTWEDIFLYVLSCSISLSGCKEHLFSDPFFFL